MIILAKLELTLLIIVTADVVFRLTELLRLTLIVLFPLTALYKLGGSQNCSLLVLSHSSTTLGIELIFLLLLFCSFFSLPASVRSSLIDHSPIPNTCELIVLLARV